MEFLRLFTLKNRLNMNFFRLRVLFFTTTQSKELRLRVRPAKKNKLTRPTLRYDIDLISTFPVN